MKALRAAILVASVSAGGCVVPLTRVSLQPVPVAGQGNRPLKAQIRKVGMTHDLTRGGANLDTGSRLAVEIDLYNADPQRTLTVQPPRLVMRDALGGPELQGLPVNFGLGALPGSIGTGDETIAPPPIFLRPGESRTVWFLYAGFPADGPAGPVRAEVIVQADGDVALQLAIADPVPGGPRWKLDRLMVTAGVAGTISTFQTGTRSGSSDVAVAPLSLELLFNWDRLFWGFGARYELLYREAIAGGPLGRGFNYFATVGVLPFRFPLGFYGQAGFLIGAQLPPAAYQQIGNDGVSNGRTLFLPQVSGGIVFNAGPRLASTGPFPINRPLSALRRFQIRAGYAQWFGLGSTAGAGGFELSFVGLIGP